MQEATDCFDIFQMGHNKSGVFEIRPINRITEGKSVYVYCDMDTQGGGWTVNIILFFLKLVSFKTNINKISPILKSTFTDGFNADARNIS